MNFIRDIKPDSLSDKFNIYIIVPVYGELDMFPDMLESLYKNDKNLLSVTAVICVVNNPPRNIADPEKVLENDILMQILEGTRNTSFSLPDETKSLKNLFFIDASSDGKEIPVKYGVGGARRIGMDTVVASIQNMSDVVLISLDADTVVAENYLSAIQRAFAENPDAAGAVVEFEHMLVGDIKTDAAIKEYEAFIRYYVRGLKYAGSPYAYHSIGSTIAVRADAYKKCGGMRPKPAGEDFYFLQALRKTGNIINITDTKVFPSGRISDRVPFGTGPAVKEIMAGNTQKFYHPLIFFCLKEFLDITKSLTINDWYILPDILDKKAPEEVNLFLSQYDFRRKWEKILKNTPKNSKHILHAFHVWFDAFKTLKFIHFCRDNFPEKYPSLNFQEATRLGGIYLQT